MTGRYWLYRRSIGHQVPIEISEARYRELASARSTLTDAASFEQKYDLLLGNYMAFESWAATYSISVAVTFDHSYDAALKTFGEANRHVMNLLSSARSYIDQVKQDFSHLPLSPPFADQAIAGLSAAYDECKEYRFLEALRNHVQHYAPPVHGIAPARQDGDQWAWVESVAFNCLREYLEENPKFKKSVLAEAAKETELRHAIRQYVAAISRTHITLRRAVAVEVEAARLAFTRAIEDFAVLNADGSVGLAAGIELENGDHENVVSILLNWDDARLKLAQKNRYPVLTA